MEDLFDVTADSESRDTRVEDLSESEIEKKKMDVEIKRLRREREAGEALSKTMAQADAGFSCDEVDRIRKRVEEALPALSCGDVLLGAATQRYSIVRGAFEPTYRMLLSAHRSAISTKINDEFSYNQQSSEAAVMLRQQLTLACTVAGINEREFEDPVPDKRLRTFKQEILDANMKAISGMPDGSYWLLWFGNTWFQVKAQETLTTEALKNG